MADRKWSWSLVWASIAFACAVLTASCGGSEGEQSPSITIEAPTSASTYATVWPEVMLGGTVAKASFVRVRNALTGTTTEGFVNFFEGRGTWFADVRGLGFGENLLVATADADGTGAKIATVEIVVVRPLQPVNLIFNGLDGGSSSTFWTDAHSVGEAHSLALFGDGTGRSTTGSPLAEAAGAVADFTWSLLAPDAIRIENCAACSFQKISRISGALDEGLFLGQIETIGGSGEIVLHAFTLMPGRL